MYINLGLLRAEKFYEENILWWKRQSAIVQRTNRPAFRSLVAPRNTFLSTKFQQQPENEKYPMKEGVWGSLSAIFRKRLLINLSLYHH